MKSLLVKLLVVLALVGGGMGVYRLRGHFPGAPAQGPSTDAPTGLVKEGPIEVAVTAAGSISSLRSSTITPPYNGYVKKVFVKVGDRVEAGAPLLSIAESATATQVEIFPLRAPFKGVIVELNAHQGKEVRAGAGPEESAALVRLEDFSAFFVEAEISELDYVKISKDMEAKIKVSAIIDRSYTGKISEMTLASKSQERWDRNKVVFPIKVQLTDKDEYLRPGMSALIDIIVARKERALLLEHEFIEKTGEAYYVTRFSGERIKVELGLQNEMLAEITAGLQAGDPVRQVDFLAGSAAGL